MEERLAAGGALVSSLAEAVRLTGKVPETIVAAILARYVPVQDDIRNRIAELSDASVLFMNSGGGWIDKQRGYSGMGMGGGAPWRRGGGKLGRCAGADARVVAVLVAHARGG